jgi:hypothetical protein
MYYECVRRTMTVPACCNVPVDLHPNATSFTVRPYTWIACCKYKVAVCRSSYLYHASATMPPNVRCNERRPAQLRSCNRQCCVLSHYGSESTLFLSMWTTTRTRTRAACPPGSATAPTTTGTAPSPLADQCPIRARFCCNVRRRLLQWSG